MIRTSAYCSALRRHTNTTTKANGDFGLAVLLKLLYIISYPPNIN